MFEHYMLGRMMCIKLNKGVSMDESTVREAVKTFLKEQGLTHALVSDYETTNQRLFEAESRIDFETLMRNNSFGSASKRSRAVKAEKARLD